jgi:predicted amidohydrolase
MPPGARVTRLKDGGIYWVLALALGGAAFNSTNWIADGYQRSVWGWSGKTTQGLAATRALENVTFVAMANRAGREGEFTSLGWSCIASPSGQVLAGLEEGEGIAVATVTLDSPDLVRWRGIASYRRDRRPDVYQTGGMRSPC